MRDEYCPKCGAWAYERQLCDGDKTWFECGSYKTLSYFDIPGHFHQSFDCRKSQERKWEKQREENRRIAQILLIKADSFPKPKLGFVKPGTRVGGLAQKR